MKLDKRHHLFPSRKKENIVLREWYQQGLLRYALVFLKIDLPICERVSACFSVRINVCIRVVDASENIGLYPSFLVKQIVFNNER